MDSQTTMVARRVAVGLRLAATDLAAWIDDAGPHRGITDGDDGERGAQAAEYAMLGGVSAAACTGLVALLKNKSTLKTLVDAVISTLGKVVEGWF